MIDKLALVITDFKLLLIIEKGKRSHHGISDVNSYSHY